uniref:Dual oxidase maturation factor 1 n=1 Tax=Timema genevievae TaxID=629358 RepID=A0A7R9JWA4_TIMGE|nr:unnamed protein product [Timema genevievae]
MGLEVKGLGENITPPPQEHRMTRYGSGWHVASTEIISSYRAFSREKIVAELGAFIGLGHVNITLRASPIHNWTEDIDFNERFSWLGSGEMGLCYREALVRGLPFPILTVAEYFSLGQEGFTWGGQYRAAGYYGAILLWASFAMWLLMNLMLVVVPRYGAYSMMVTGVLLVSTDLVYYSLLPLNPLLVRFEGSTLTFSLGWCFWLVLTAAMLRLSPSRPPSHKIGFKLELDRAKGLKAEFFKPGSAEPLGTTASLAL